MLLMHISHLLYKGPAHVLFDFEDSIDKVGAGVTLGD
jgi:hypothetical protein